MAITLDHIWQLCMEGESNHLDYKREQYPFVGVSVPEKAELLKDVLAMANAFRHETAYILIGVGQQPDGRGQIVGIKKDKFIDDAKLQQFINEKTNRVVEFSSYSVEIDGERVIQVIEIPVQRERPYYPQNRLGEVGEKTVFVRVGSSTRLAIPDEIARMGKEDQALHNQRLIDISIQVPGNAIGDIDFKALEVSLMGEPPVEKTQPFFDTMSWPQPITFLKKFTYVRDVFRTIRVDAGLENKSSLSAEQLEIESFISQCSNNCVKELEEFPSRPSGYPALDNITRLKPASLQTPKLHPGKYNPSFESLYFEVTHDGDFTLEVTVRGKDMQPITKLFHIDVRLKPYPIKAEEVKMFFDSLKDEDTYLDWKHFIQKEKENDHA